MWWKLRHHRYLEFCQWPVNMELTNGTVALDYSGDGTVDTNLGFSMDVTFDYSSSGAWQFDCHDELIWQRPGFVHVAAEYDSSLNLEAYNAKTTSHIGDDSSVNSVDWSSISGNSMTVTDQGSGVPGSIVIRNDATSTNFTLPVMLSIPRQLVISPADFHRETGKWCGTDWLATGTVHGMGAVMRNSSLAMTIIAATFCMTGAPVHAAVSWSDLLQDLICG